MLLPKLEDEKLANEKFLFGSDETIEAVIRGSYRASLLARTRGLDVVREVIPSKITFYVDSGQEWPGFEFIYVLDGQLQYIGADPPVTLEAGSFIARHLTQERAYFQTMTDAVLLHVCSPPAFHLMRSEAEEFYEVARKLDADEYVSGHCKRLENYAVRVGEKLHLSGEQMGELSYAAFFHDIGKADVPLDILLKPNKLTDTEWKLIKNHSTWGRQMMEGKEFLEMAAQIVEESHERIDGEGYPKGLKGDEITLEARIIAVVDAYDAMTTTRAYRDAMPKEDAIRELEEGIGTQFDRQVVEAFIDVLEQYGGPSEEKEEAWLSQELTQLKQREAFLRIGEAILAGSDIDDILSDVVNGIVRYTPFNQAIIALYDSPVDPTSVEPASLVQIAYAGARSDSAIADLKDTYSLLPCQRTRIFTDECRVSRSYYVPAGVRSRQQTDQHSSVGTNALTGGAWNTGDLLCIPMWVEEHYMIGLIGVDEPAHTLTITAQILEPIEMFANLSAIAVLEARKKKQLTEMALRDPLTQVYNRHFLAEMIEKEWARAKRCESPISLIMIDFVNFREVNVEFGHLEGDRLLEAAAGVLMLAVRDADCVVRYGGDEFLIVMPETGEEEARTARKRITESIRGHDFGLPRQLDIRVGSSTWHKDDPRQFNEILDEADKWMYRRSRDKSVPDSETGSSPRKPNQG